MKIKCDYCGSVIKPGHRPTGEPNGVGFHLEDGKILSMCYHCICCLPNDSKMQKWLEQYERR